MFSWLRRNSRSGDALIERLSHAERDVRGAAARTLLERGDPRALPVMLEICCSLHDDSPEIADALARVRPFGPDIARLATAGDATISARAVSVLALLGDAELAAGPVAAALLHEDHVVRLTALNAAKRLGDERAVDGVVACLEHPKLTGEALASLSVLAKRGVAIPAQPIAAVLLHRTWGGRAAMLLHVLGWQPATTADRARLAIAELRWEDAAALGPDAVPAIIDAIGTSDVLAARALGQLRDPRAVEPLVEVLDRGSDDARKEAALALRAIGLEHVDPERHARIRSAIASETDRERQVREIRELVGKAIDVPRGWTGLPAGKDPRASAPSDFVQLPPGTYVGGELLEAGGSPWIRLRQGSLEFVVDATDVWLARLR